MFTGYALTRDTRSKLLQQFPPHYEKPIAHHVTLRFGIGKQEPAPPMPNEVLIVGHFDSGDGVEGYTVSVDGETKRPDGELFHITWSLADGRKPVESNKYTRTAKTISPVKINVERKNFHNV